MNDISTIIIWLLVASSDVPPTRTELEAQVSKLNDHRGFMRWLRSRNGQFMLIEHLITRPENIIVPEAIPMLDNVWGDLQNVMEAGKYSDFLIICGLLCDEDTLVHFIVVTQHMLESDPDTRTTDYYLMYSGMHLLAAKYQKLVTAIAK